MSSAERDTKLQTAMRFVGELYGGAATAGFQHARQVAQLLDELGASADVVIAGLLHDTVEDGIVEHDQLSRRFGPRVAELVAALTDDAEITDLRERRRRHRQAVLAGGFSALMIFAADKAARMRAVEASGDVLPLDTLEHYRRSLELLVASGIRTPHVDEFDQRLRRYLSRPSRTTTRLRR